ncbi:serpin family protein [Candidatus Poriferisodalis sp.]|uniref:serpin family protein n=1 Tax=Candidatus Poriferisodalis sp. TaxID=3101277 RepID=UPI003D1255C8
MAVPLGFCPGAGFDGIAPGIFITSALHSAKVIVDEKGTEAAAATSMGFELSAPPPPDLTVVADRPFLWAIIHQQTQAVLFIGRLVDPTA